MRFIDRLTYSSGPAIHISSAFKGASLSEVLLFRRLVASGVRRRLVQSRADAFGLARNPCGED